MWDKRFACPINFTLPHGQAIRLPHDASCRSAGDPVTIRGPFPEAARKLEVKKLYVRTACLFNRGTVEQFSGSSSNSRFLAHRTVEMVSMNAFARVSHVSREAVAMHSFFSSGLFSCKASLNLEENCAGVSAKYTSFS